MEDKPVQRRLAAVLAADVAGYTRMMEADEDATMSSWYTSRSEVIDPKIAEHKGRIVKLTGDGFLARLSAAARRVGRSMPAWVPTAPPGQQNT